MDHRGRAYYYEDTPRSRHRSLGRQAMDKLEDAMESLKLDSHSRGTNALEVIPYHAGRHRSPSHHRHHSSSYHHHSHHRHRSPSHHRHHSSHHPHSSRRYHSSSPTRHYTTHRGRPSSPHDSSDYASSRSRSRHWSHGLQAGVEAAAIEAYRLRNEPGGWKGAKAGRVATAALSAGVIGVAAEQRRGRRHEDDDEYGGKKGALGAAMGGLAVNRLVNGPRRDVR
ncbi:hypothetical protein QBC39DRAFT_372318 [Podospora conica]|nr:hypothetical protein QBC39DRAFT_372318 [Schizothecium conicum]